MASFKINLGIIKSLTDEKLMDFTPFVVSSLTDNPYFPEPLPTLGKVTDRYNLFQQARAAQRVTRSPQTKLDLGNVRSLLKQDLLGLADYVMKTQTEDRAIAETSGFPFSVERPTKAKMPPSCLHLDFEFTSNLGEILLIAPIWRDGSKPTIYGFQQSLDLRHWDMILPTGTSSKKLVTGLQPGTTYNFRACYQNAAGSGEFCRYVEVTMLTAVPKGNRMAARG